MIILRDILAFFVSAIIGIGSIISFVLMFTFAIIYYKTLPYAITHGLIIMSIKWAIAIILILFVLMLLYGLIYTWVDNAKYRSRK